MKKIIILFFITTIGYCQSVDNIKKQTLFMSYSQKKEFKKKIYNSNFRDYRYCTKTKKDGKSEYLIFEKPDRPNALTENGHPRIDTRQVNTSFLKTKKNSTIDLNFINKFENHYIACELLTDNKILYIIDLTEKKATHIALYRVNLVYFCPVYE